MCVNPHFCKPSCVLFIGCWSRMLSVCVLAASVLLFCVLWPSPCVVLWAVCSMSCLGYQGSLSCLLCFRSLCCLVSCHSHGLSEGRPSRVLFVSKSLMSCVCAYLLLVVMPAVPCVVRTACRQCIVICGVCTDRTVSFCTNSSKHCSLNCELSVSCPVRTMSCLSVC